VRPRALVRTEREFVETPDGDELVLDQLCSDALQRVDGGLKPAAPHFLLLHGLEGSSRSVYIQGILSILARHWFSATAVNFRSCVRPNRRPRLYHSGETEDFDFVVRTMRSRLPHAKFAAFGASLGGNVLLKWLGEHSHQTDIAAAATISVPYDLGAGAVFMERGFGSLYVKNFLRSLKKKTREVVARHPEVTIDVARAIGARTFVDFDNAATAPLHGFTDANDYYVRSSSLGFLGRITTPTLCVSAEDDPFLPPDALARARAAASPAVEFIVTKRGGHVGFVGGRVPWKPVYWAEELVVEWLRTKIGA